MKTVLMTLALLLAGTAFAHGPDGDKHEETSAVGSGGLARLPDGSVQVPKLAQRRMAIRTVLAAESEAAATLQLPGRVIADPNASGQVQSAHGGRIEAGPRGLPLPGQKVQAGEVLAWVRHHAEPYAYAAQQAQRSELQAARLLAESRLKRLESLEGTVPRKDIEAARVELASLAAREKGVAESISAREALRAPISGVVARSELKVGAIVESRELLVEVVDPARWIIEATSTDAALASRIAGARLAEAGGAELQVLGAARVLRDGVLPINFRIRSKADAALSQGQSVGVIVQLSDKRKGVRLPSAAVVRGTANEAVVWVKTGAERYRPAPVQTQPLDDSTVLVTQGLAAGQRVVIQGAALVAQIR